MLLLTRKVGEKLRIGDNIEVVITGIEGGRVRIGILAPVRLSITRPKVEDETRASDVDPSLVPSKQPRPE